MGLNNMTHMKPELIEAREVRRVDYNRIKSDTFKEMEKLNEFFNKIDKVGEAYSYNLELEIVEYEGQPSLDKDVLYMINEILNRGFVVSVYYPNIQTPDKYKLGEKYLCIAEIGKLEENEYKEVENLIKGLSEKNASSSLILKTEKR